MDTARHAIQVVDFDRMQAGAAPEGWACGVTGKGQPRWTIEADPTAPSKPHMLKVGVWTKADSVTLFDDFRFGAAP